MGSAAGDRAVCVRRVIENMAWGAGAPDGGFRPLFAARVVYPSARG
jgi:hypothetical protein